MSDVETMFVRLHEYNDNEGEAWDWWLQLTGNEAEVDKLAGLIDAAYEDESDSWHELYRDDVEPESVVDKLVEYASSGYYAAHGKVTGVLTCPADLGEDAEALYKGGVTDLFTEAASSAGGEG